MDNWHIDAIVYCLEQCIEGKMPHLMINMPPRHLKSFIASVALPAFILGNDPTAKIISVSYSDELTKTLARDFRRIVESKWYRMLYPAVVGTKKTENEFVTTEGGFRFATSVGGTLTGKGGDFIIIDDPIKPEETHSDTIRKSVNEWFKSTLLSRLEDKKRSVLILVMQRLHVNDLCGFLEDVNFHKLSLPAIGIFDENIPTGENQCYMRKAGSPLHEEREDLKTLEKIKDLLGPFNFSAQYQQRPETPDGDLFKKDWIKITGNFPNQVSRGRLIISFDTAASTAETADYTAMSVVYSTQEGHYVLSAERGRWDYETLVYKAFTEAKKYKHYDITFIVENSSSGISLIQTLKKANFKCFSAKARLDKTARAAYILPIIHQGRLFIVNIEGKNSWVEPYINEIVSFPNGKFDDQVDSLVHALYWAEPIVNPQGRIHVF